MGCAGSKPHHLLSSSITHSNSPQKGFILFNSKTIEYLKANENEIKAKLVERCEQKLLKVANGSGHATNSAKSLFGTSKKAFLSSSASANDNKSVVVAEQNGAATKTFSVDKISDVNKFKETAIDSAVDYVLKYAINDFDIENFKSSNHLSMKQIRKDIMKKNSAGVMSMSKLNTTANTSTLSKDASVANGVGNTSINHSTTTSFGTLKNSDAAFYKLALNTTIDEFGLFIQENFVVINEFQAAKHSSGSLKKSEENVVANGKTPTEGGLNAEEEAALKLKEALELARQNFYKGKMSMVCLTKTGGYVVKEVKDNENTSAAGPEAGQQELVVPVTVETPITPVKPKAISADEETGEQKEEQSSSSPITPENLSNAKTVTILDPQTNQKSKVAISSKINIEDVDISATFKIIETNQNEFSSANGAPVGANESGSTLDTSTNSHAELTATTGKKTSRTSLRLSKKDKSKSKVQATPAPEEVPAVAVVVDNTKAESMAEFMKVKSDLSQILNNTIESIVTYSTKPVENEIEKVEGEEAKTSQTDESIKALEENLKKAKEIVEFLNKLTEKEYKLIDEKVVETTISLDYINREFKSYLTLFEAVLKENAKSGEEETNKIEKNAEIAKLVEQLDKLITELPKELFSAKGLPHPADVNGEDESTLAKVADVTVSPPATEPKNVKSAKSKSAKSKETQPKTPVAQNGEHQQNGDTPQTKSGRSKKNKADSINGGSSKKSSPFKKIIDIKKEIAISILNVGEVLAKTIDYYSLSSSSGNKEEDLKELIKISEQQAAKQTLAKQQAESVESNGNHEVSAIVEESQKEATTVESVAVVEEVKKVETVEEVVKIEEAAEEKKSEENPETVKIPDVQVNGVEESLAAPVEGLLQVNVLTDEPTKDLQQQDGSSEDVTGKDASSGQQQQQQSTTASSMSSPTLSTTSSLSASRTGSDSPVPPISSSSSEQQQLSNIEECTESVSNRKVTAEATSESTPVITNERVVSASDSETNEGKTEVLPSEDLLIESAAAAEKSKIVIEESQKIKEIVEDVEQPKHADDTLAINEGSYGLRKDISFLVNEMMNNNQNEEKLVLGHDESSSSKLCEDESAQIKSDSSESSSDILSSSNNDELTKPDLNLDDECDEKLLDQSSEIEQPQAPEVVYRNNATSSNTDSSNASSNGSSSAFNGSGVGKRMSLDEELMYQLEEVDKKVKYMNETCSENEGDDDDDDDRSYHRRRSLDDDDDDVDLEQLENEDDERLFHPRTPAKIKSEVRQQRKNEIQEEIKQISSVIQDLVQTINVKNSNSSTSNVVMLNSETDSMITDFYKTPNNSITLNTSCASSERKRSVNSNNSKRSSVSSTHSNSFSSIPVRQQKILTKQKATTASIEDESHHHQQILTTTPSLIDEETLSFKSVVCSPNSSDIFADLDSSPNHHQVSVNKKFKSKLPVKK